MAIMELHTFSSLNADFLKEYAGSMDKANIAIVYFNPEVIKHKKLTPITIEQVKASFQNKKLLVFTEQKDLIDFINESDLSEKNVLFMSSGNFSGIDLVEYSKSMLNN
jgi:UDP-N-acetylmuramate: L-alanyl-gamma-D-glutamyl-meso-diaminopimelate ligase